MPPQVPGLSDGCSDSTTEDTSRGGQRAIVKRSRSDDQPAIPLEPPTRREVQWRAVDAGHASAGLLDDEAARRVVPDLLDVAAARQPEVELGVAPTDNRVLRLAVHAQRRRADPELVGDS